MLNFSEVNKLGQILDTTWGKSSTIAPTISIKACLENDRMKVVFSSYYTFASNQAMSQRMPAIEAEAVQGVDKYLKLVKDAFKESSGKSLKTEVVSQTPSVEIISLQSHISPRRTVLFRYTVVL